MADKLLEKSWEQIDSLGDKFRIQTTVSAAESAYVDGESGLVIGHCKAIVEGMCKTILDEKSIKYANNSKVSWLAKKAIHSLGVADGVENEKKARDAFKSLVSSFAHHFEIAAKAIGELRNDFCPLSHGKPATHKPLDLSYAEFIAMQTDAIVGFIYALYVNHKVLKPDTSYNESQKFNEYLNDEFGVIEIYGDSYLSSDILYQLNTEKYEQARDEYKEQKEEGAE